MALLNSYERDTNLVLVEGKLSTRILTLNRPQKLNSLNYDMVSELSTNLRAFEKQNNIKLVILKGNGKAFCAGGDVAALVGFVTLGHWTFGATFYKKQLILDHLIATYEKPLVSIINGIVMGGGAGLSMHGKFRVVTENAVFCMPEVSLGLFPDVGASHFLSRLPGFFGEYLGLTGARIDGGEMSACGLATHFVPSVNLPSLERELCRVNSGNATVIGAIIDVFAQKVPTREESGYWSLDVINKCFSKNTIEEIFSALEHEAVNGDKWVLAAIKSMKSASPTSLKISLKSIRVGRKQNINQCLIREFRMASHTMRRTVNSDFYEGVRAILLDKDKKPKWQPSKLELVTPEMVDQFFTKVDDEDWEDLQIRNKFGPASLGHSKL
ncbi:hypothetical protein Syun_018323 [Stephania yunnanensis]|uniref:3-hydroxyisobutyryl-CoA hydrolase n=1 Tax=Stephania yunnanensis TaxID=152371 RepID=A0AAP0IUB8_9MAGN